MFKLGRTSWNSLRFPEEEPEAWRDEAVYPGDTESGREIAANHVFGTGEHHVACG